jgi:hypothetical protein
MSHIHGFQGRTRNDDQRAFFLESFKQHIHSAQLKCHRVVLVLPAGLGKLLGYFRFSSAENDPGLALTFGLGLLAHGVRKV